MSITENNQLDIFSDLFLKYGIDADGIGSYVITDLSKPGSYGKTVLFIFNDAVCTLSEDGSFARKSFAEIRDIFSENYVSSGELIISTTDEDVSFAHFTLKISAEIERFVTSVKKLISGEDIAELPPIDNSDSKFQYINNGRKKLFFRVLSYVPRYKKHLFQMLLSILLFL